METLSGISGLTVMVVEDEYLIALNLEMALEEYGARVVGPFPRVPEALDHLASQGPPDIAVLDINVAGTPVFPVAERLADENVPFVFATGYDKWTIPPAFGDVPRLSKPTDPAQLVKSLMRAARLNETGRVA